VTDQNSVVHEVSEQQNVSRPVHSWLSVSKSWKKLTFAFSSVRFYRAMLCRAWLCHAKSSVCPSVTFKYADHTGWNTSKIISGTKRTPQSRVGSVSEQKTCYISESRQDRTKVTMTD